MLSSLQSWTFLHVENVARLVLAAGLWTSLRDTPQRVVSNATGCSLKLTAFWYYVCSFPSRHLKNCIQVITSRDDTLLRNAWQVVKLERDTRKSLVKRSAEWNRRTAGLMHLLSFSAICSAFDTVLRVWRRTVSIEISHRGSFTIPSQRLPLSDVIPLVQLHWKQELLSWLSQPWHWAARSGVPRGMAEGWNQSENAPIR